MSKLEDEAIRNKAYPLNLTKREEEARDMSKAKLAAAGVRYVELGTGLRVSMAFKADGVGTKILVAEAMKVYNTVGIDAVAMTVNDVICVGAKPVMIVDYLAHNRDDSSMKKL